MNPNRSQVPHTVLTSTPKRALLYLRVSSKEQMDTAIDIDPDGNSIATQRELCEQKATVLDADVVHEFVERGASAKTTDKRPVFREMLAFLLEHRDIDYVIVYMRSRAFRNHFDAAIVGRQLEQIGVRLVSVKEDFGEGPHAVAMEGFTDIMNGLQNTLSGLDIQVKLRHKAINGGTIGATKLGYLNVRVEYEGRMINTVQLDTDRAPLVRKAWELYASGDYTLERLEATMADMGLTARANCRWPERLVSFKWYHRMLKDPYYLGYVVYKGELYPGRHDPLVSQELFDRVQDVMNVRSQPGQRDRVHQHYLKGALFCDRCERHERTSRLVYTKSRGRNGQYYNYFFCRGRQDGLCDLPYLSVDQVEEAVGDYYATLQLPAGFTADVRKLLESTMAEEQSSVRAMHASLTRRLKDLDVKEERLLDLAADGELPQAKIKARLRRIQGERISAEGGLTNTAAELAIGVEIMTSALDLIANPHVLYRDADDAVRRHLNQTFYERFYLDDNGVSSGVLNPPFDELHRAARDHTPTWLAPVPVPWAQATKKDSRDAEALDRRHERSFLRTEEHARTGVLSVTGSSTDSLVELRGFEPLASSMRTRRATNCATAPGSARETLAVHLLAGCAR